LVAYFAVTVYKYPEQFQDSRQELATKNLGNDALRHRLIFAFNLDCKDANKSCAGWAKLGECKKNPVWMHVNCKKSCDVCSKLYNLTRCKVYFTRLYNKEVNVLSFKLS
jgi:hypothetical protein